MHIKKYDIFFTLVIAGKLDLRDYNHLKEVNEVPPRFGFNWWFWMPRFRFNPKESVTVFEIKWLMFIYSIDKY